MFMLDITIVNWVYKPTKITGGAPSCITAETRLQSPRGCHFGLDWRFDGGITTQDSGDSMRLTYIHELGICLQPLQYNMHNGFSNRFLTDTWESMTMYLSNETTGFWVALFTSYAWTNPYPPWMKYLPTWLDHSWGRLGVQETVMRFFWFRQLVDLLDNLQDSRISVGKNM